MPDTIPTSPTDAQILAELRTALLHAARGMSYSVNGVSYSRQNIRDLQALIKEYEDRIALEAANAISPGLMQVKVCY